MKRRTFLSSMLAGTASAGFNLGTSRATSATPNPIILDTTSATYVLFFDMQELESLHNAEIVVNPGEKHPANPVVPTGDLNDFDYHQATAWAGSVIFDEDEKVFKLWYFGARGGLDFTAIGYAWSEDGLFWHKPKLGLYEFRGSKENNICWQSPTGVFIHGVLHSHVTDHFAVFKDYREPDPQKRYKGWTIIYFESAKRNWGFPIYSADGTHWRLGSTPVAHYPIGDIGNAMFDIGAVTHIHVPVDLDSPVGIGIFVINEHLGDVVSGVVGNRCGTEPPVDSVRGVMGKVTFFLAASEYIWIAHPVYLFCGSGSR